jgi:hypothetical protein
MTASAGTIGTSWMPTAAGPSESDSRKVGKSAREQWRRQQHSAGTLGPAAGTYN